MIEIIDLLMVKLIQNPLPTNIDLVCFWVTVFQFLWILFFLALPSLLLRNRNVGHRNWIPPFRVTFTLRLRSIHPQGHWKNVLFYGNNNGERALAVWVYPHNPGHGLCRSYFRLFDDFHKKIETQLWDLDNHCVAFFFKLAGRLHIRVTQTRNGNDGCDPGKKIHINHATKVTINVGIGHMGAHFFTFQIPHLILKTRKKWSFLLCCCWRAIKWKFGLMDILFVIMHGTMAEWRDIFQIDYCG